MLFNQNKGFFLTLDETAEPVSLDLPDAAAVEEPAADASVTAQPSLVVAAVEAPAASEATTSEAKAVDEVAAAVAAVQTTAEAIAANITNRYLACFQQLRLRLRQRLQQEQGEA